MKGAGRCVRFIFRVCMYCARSRTGFIGTENGKDLPWDSAPIAGPLHSVPGEGEGVGVGAKPLQGTASAFVFRSDGRMIWLEQGSLDMPADIEVDMSLQLVFPSKCGQKQNYE